MIMDSRIKEHLQSQDKDIARKSSRPKAQINPPPIHPGMASRTRGTLGGPPNPNYGPDASSPLPTDPEKQHGSKRFPIPACHSASKSDPERGTYDPSMADKVMGEAARPVSDFAPNLHTLPATVKED
jgi:hypothetical protein